MFETIEVAPPDAILGLNEAFQKDSAPRKINLGVGVFKDQTGVTPILKCVKEAERRLVESERSKSYLAIDGDPGFGRHVARLLLGNTTEFDRVATLQTPGGTGALRIAAEFVHAMFPSASIWTSTPTWANHPNVFKAAGLPVKTYRYFDPATNALDFDAMMEDLQTVPSGDVVLLHACCHNPTGVDPTLEQWQQIGALLSARQLLPLVDFAYQGFAEGLDEDAEGLRSLLQHLDELLVCSSFSKNFGLYRERVGALTAVSQTPAHSEAVLSQLKAVVRANYSNPPAHGAAIVATILEDRELTEWWHQELAEMRDRINGNRELLVANLAAAGIDRDFSFIRRQRGMFSFSGLTAEQVQSLRREHSIYIVGSGRINVAGITEDNVGHLCQAIAQVSWVPS